MTNLLNHPAIEIVPVASLRLNDFHPRKHPPKQIDAIAASMRRFGCIVPPVIDDGDPPLVISGVGRVLAARQEKFETIPVIRARFLSEADRRAFVLADSKLAEGATWDEEQLKAELQFLFEAEYDFSVTGFEMRDLDFAVPGEAAEDPLVEVPLPNSAGVTRPGDLWTVGEHSKLFCGSSRDRESFDHLLGEERAAAIVSDPPYNVRLREIMKGDYREFAEASGEMSPVEFVAFLRSVFRHCVYYSINGSTHHHFMDWRHMREILDAADGVYEELRQLGVWVKDAPGMGSYLRSQHELCFIFRAGKAKARNFVELGKHGRNRSNCWFFPGANTSKTRKADLAAHPTTKNSAMLVEMILDVTTRGELVLDPFSGSGATLIAAHRAGRRGAAIEIDPLYCDTTLRRLSLVTGRPAVHADGRTFEEMADARLSEGKGNG